MRKIIHLDLDTFYVSVERLKDSSLIGKPVLVGSDSSRGVVASCSYEARKFGIHAGMSMAIAKRQCKFAVIRGGNYDDYHKYSDHVTHIIEERSPLVEKVMLDEHYIDMTGMDLLVKSTYNWAQELKKKIIKETGLPISFGLSTSKTVAKIATGQGKPVGEQYVLEGHEKEYLAPLPVRKIPGVGEKSEHELRVMGLITISNIQQVPKSRMVSAFGKYGENLWNISNGIDNSMVLQQREQKSMSKEQTFKEDTIDTNFIKSIIVAMVFELNFILRKENKLTGCVQIKIKYSDHSYEEHQKSIPHTSNDEIIQEKLVSLFIAKRKRQLIRLIGIKFTKLVYGHMPTDLFSVSDRDRDRYAVLDKIRKRFGDKAVLLAINAENPLKRK